MPQTLIHVVQVILCSGPAWMPSAASRQASSAFDPTVAPRSAELVEVAEGIQKNVCERPYYFAPIRAHFAALMA